MTTVLLKDYPLHRDCFFEGLKKHILMGDAKIPFKFDTTLNPHVLFLFYDPTYVIDFLYDYFAEANEEGQKQLESLVSQFLKNWEEFARIITKEIPCQNSQCDGFYSNSEQDINYKPVGKKCEKCGTIYEGEDFSKFKKIRLCRNCGLHVEKMSGCDAVTCPRCKTKFSWRNAPRVKKSRKPRFHFM